MKKIEAVIRPEKLDAVASVPTMMAVALIAMSALSVIFGIWPALITNPIEVFIAHIFHHSRRENLPPVFPLSRVFGNLFSTGFRVCISLLRFINVSN